MKKKHSLFVVAILTFVLAVSSVGCGMNTAEEQGPDEEILNLTKSMKMLDEGFTDILIKDEESAIKAASESAKELGYVLFNYCGRGNILQAAANLSGHTCIREICSCRGR